MATPRTNERPPAGKGAEAGADPNPYGWWYADCPRHGRTPHLSVFGGLCERCAAELRDRAGLGRTRQ